MDLKDLTLLSHSLTVLRSLSGTHIYKTAARTLSALQESPAAFCSAYGELAALIFENGALDTQLMRELHYSENVLTSAACPSQALLAAADADLCIVNAFACLDPAELKAAAMLAFPGNKTAVAALPLFPKGKVLPVGSGHALWQFYQKEGFGYFARGSAFALRDGALVQLPPPEITLGDLKGYDWQKKAILDNTAAFLRGENANNILLYGDKGCGKSSTVKAVAEKFAADGLKIIAFSAKDVADFGKVAHLLEKSPYRFILFMDDLSFDAETPEFVALKAFMEGGMAEKNKNTLIYATSNRRHLIRETHSDRLGDDIHIRETLETQTSLSDRFGMEIIFSVPSKDEYLFIVEALAEEMGIALPKETLFARAEAFALRKNGRSPRTARQFLQVLKTEQ